MGATAKTIGIFYLVLIVSGAVVALAVAWSTLGRRRLHTDPKRLAERERLWMAAVLAALAALLFSTIFFAPYGESAGPGKQVVRVVASQFAWDVRPSTVEAGVPVEFRLTAKDVTHGLGIYDRGGVLLKQVQVPPGHEQRLVYTFDRPGTYRFLCLEYCGFGHHLMETTIRVVAR